MLHGAPLPLRFSLFRQGTCGFLHCHLFFAYAAKTGRLGGTTPFPARSGGVRRPRVSPPSQRGVPGPGCSPSGSACGARSSGSRSTSTTGALPRRQPLTAAFLTRSAVGEVIAKARVIAAATARACADRGGERFGPALTSGPQADMRQWSALISERPGSRGKDDRSVRRSPPGMSPQSRPRERAPTGARRPAQRQRGASAERRSRGT